MKTKRRRFLQTTAATAAVKLPGVAAGSSTGEALGGYEIAGRHTIVCDHPTPSFFEGMLLGTGDVAVCATVRPDGMALHLGKSDSWDIRVSEDHFQHVLVTRVRDHQPLEVREEGKVWSFPTQAEVHYHIVPAWDAHMIEERPGTAWGPLIAFSPAVVIGQAPNNSSPALTTQSQTILAFRKTDER